MQLISANPDGIVNYGIIELVFIILKHESSRKAIHLEILGFKISDAQCHVVY